MTYTVTVYRVERIHIAPLPVLDAPMPLEPIRVEADDVEDVHRQVAAFMAAHPEYTRANITPEKN